MNIIKEFENIRDIPYKIPLTLEEEDNCCSGKAMRLKKILEDVGYTVRYRVVEFRWDALRIPSDILALPHDDTATHVYLEVKIGDEWIDVDPTWDKKLAKIFEISYWDGKIHTQVAVPIIKKYSDEKSDMVMSFDEVQVEEDIKKNGEFYRALNEWFEEVRNNHG